MGRLCAETAGRAGWAEGWDDAPARRGRRSVLEGRGAARSAGGGRALLLTMMVRAVSMLRMEHCSHRAPLARSSSSPILVLDRAPRRRLPPLTRAARRGRSRSLQRLRRPIVNKKKYHRERHLGVHRVQFRIAVRAVRVSCGTGETLSIVPPWLAGVRREVCHRIARIMDAPAADAQLQRIYVSNPRSSRRREAAPFRARASDNRCHQAQ